MSRAKTGTIAGVLLLVTTVVLSLVSGAVNIDLTRAFLHPYSMPDGVVLWNERLPRTLLALIIGGGLAVAGTAFQALLQNPLADPYIIGVSGGAAVGGTIAATLLPYPAIGIPVLALTGAAATTFLLYRLSLDTRGRLKIYQLLLTGVIFNAFAGALILLLRAVLTPQRGVEALGWLMGSLTMYRPGIWVITAAGIVVLAGFAFLFYKARAINVIALGRQEAMAMGVDADRLQVQVFVVASVITGITVAFAGLIGFVGIIVPHAVRLVTGPDHTRVLPWSLLMGGAFLLLSDIVVRMGFRVYGSELPVGVFTALVGGPIFIHLLRKTHG